MNAADGTTDDHVPRRDLSTTNNTTSMCTYVMRVSAGIHVHFLAEDSNLKPPRGRRWVEGATIFFIFLGACSAGKERTCDSRSGGSQETHASSRKSVTVTVEWGRRSSDTQQRRRAQKQSKNAFTGSDAGQQRPLCAPSIANQCFEAPVDSEPATHNTISEMLLVNLATPGGAACTAASC